MLKKALVIDDETDICQLLVAFLKKNNYKTYSAFNITDGLSLCRSHHPDLIFLDNNLPDGSGIDAIAEFHSITPESRVIVISALTGLEEMAMKAGAISFVGKPISYLSIKKYL